MVQVLSWCLPHGGLYLFPEYFQVNVQIVFYKSMSNSSHIPCELMTSHRVHLTLGCTYWLSWLYNSAAIKQVSYWIVSRPVLHCHKKSRTSWWCVCCIWCLFSCPHSLQTDTKICYHCFISNLSLSLPTPPLSPVSCSHMSVVCPGWTPDQILPYSGMTIFKNAGKHFNICH